MLAPSRKKGEHISWEGKHIFGHCYRKVKLSFHLRFPDFLIFLAEEKLCAGVFMAKTEREKAREMKYLRTNRHTYYILVLAARLLLLRVSSNSFPIPFLLLDAFGACSQWLLRDVFMFVCFVLFIVVVPLTDMPQFFFIFPPCTQWRWQLLERCPRWMGCFPNNLTVSFNALRQQDEDSSSSELTTSQGN